MSLVTGKDRRICPEKEKNPVGKPDTSNFVIQARSTTCDETRGNVRYLCFEIVSLSIFAGIEVMLIFA